MAKRRIEKRSQTVVIKGKVRLVAVRWRPLVGGGLLVGLGRSVVLVLLGLVRDGVAGGLDTVGWGLANCCRLSSDGCMKRCLPSAETSVVVLGNVLVGLLGSLVGGALDLVGDVVTGLLDGIHDD